MLTNDRFTVSFEIVRDSVGEWENYSEQRITADTLDNAYFSACDMVNYLFREFQRAGNDTVEARAIVEDSHTGKSVITPALTY